MWSILKKLSGGLLLPSTCILCRNLADRAEDLCSGCYNDLPILTQSCIRCANVLADAQQNLLCGFCLKQPPPFDYTFALFLYQPPITQLIRQLKFSAALLHAQLLGELLLEEIGGAWYQEKLLPEVIIPVPLHKKRWQERGFNQALEIARPVAKKLHLPLLTQGITRHKSTLAQTMLTANARQQNIRHAFSITADVKNKFVAVVDDVITTGNTIKEFCHVLKTQGAARIDVWCCARTKILSS